MIESKIKDSGKVYEIINNAMFCLIHFDSSKYKTTTISFPY